MLVLSSQPVGRIFRAFIEPAMAAGRVIMDIYARGHSVTVKADQSPVTEADEQAERVILESLETSLPDLPVIAEEQVAAGRIPDIGDAFILVDPLDGTREFISRNGEFTVNIALVRHRRPVAGVIYAPALGRLFYGEQGHGAWQATIAPEGDPASVRFQPIRPRPAPADGLTVVASRSHRDAETEAFLKSQNVRELVSAGSSLKFCLLAAGEADLYPRFGRTMEWDIAAGDAILTAAGGIVTCADGTPLLYGKQDRGFDNPPFIARGSASTHP